MPTLRTAPTGAGPRHACIRSLAGVNHLCRHCACLGLHVLANTCLAPRSLLEVTHPSLLASDRDVGCLKRFQVLVPTPSTVLTTGEDVTGTFEPAAAITREGPWPRQSRVRSSAYPPRSWSAPPGTSGSKRALVPHEFGVCDHEQTRQHPGGGRRARGRQVRDRNTQARDSARPGASAAPPNLDYGCWQNALTTLSAAIVNDPARRGRAEHGAF